MRNAIVLIVGHSFFYCSIVPVPEVLCKVFRELVEQVIKGIMTYHPGDG